MIAVHVYVTLSGQKGSFRNVYINSNSNMTLTFSHSTLWKCYRDQITIIQDDNIVHAKGHI